MKVYSIRRNRDQSLNTVTEALKEAMTEYFHCFLSEIPFEMPHGHPALFWGQSVEGWFCVRVFYEPFGPRQWEALRGEIEHLERHVTSFLFYVFFPSLDKEWEAGLPAKSLVDWNASAFREIRFLEYFFLSPSEQNKEAIALKEHLRASASDSESYRQLGKRHPGEKGRRGPLCEPPYNFFRVSALSREELSEFLELGLKLKFHHRSHSD